MSWIYSALDRGVSCIYRVYIYNALDLQCPGSTVTSIYRVYIYNGFDLYLMAWM